jgi:D-aspartate ligase
MRVMNTALIISGHTMGLGVIRGLGIANIPIVLLTYQKSDSAIASRYVQKSITVPHPTTEEIEFVEALKAVVDCYPNAIVFPASDASLSVVSRHKAEIEAHGCQLACPEWEITRLFLDKIHTYELAEKIGVPVPRTRLISSLEELEMHRDSFMYPCIVKPHQSHLFYASFHTKMFLVNNADELSSRLQAALNAKLDVMVQEIVQGPDSNGANYNSYHYHGQGLVEFTARKIRSGPPRFGSPRVLLTQDIPEIKEPGRKILTAMEFCGFQCTEFKRDERDGVYKLLDINGRHNLSSMLAIETGINFPYLHYQHLAANVLPEPLDYQKDVYWIDLVRDLAYSLKYFGKEDNSLRDFLRPYFHQHVFAILSFKDPKPFIRRIAHLFKDRL